MTKRSRVEEGADQRTLLKRRGRTAPDAGEGTEPTERRRIAGERPKPAESESEDATEAAVVDPDDDQDAEGSGGRGDERTDPKSVAQLLAAVRPERARVVAAVTAAAVGVLVGALLTGLVYAGMQAFQAIYHTPAGNSAGAAVLVVVLVVSILAGRFLLRLRGLPDPNATSLLGVMLMVIATLGVLLPIVFSVWMLAITPLLGAVSYLVSHLLIAHFGDHG